MKRVGELYVLLAIVMVSSSGCMAKESDFNSTVIKSSAVYMKEEKKVMKSEAIVIFKKGVTLDEAKNILAGHGIVIIKKYKALSAQNNQLYLSVRSSMRAEELVETLQKNSSVHSASANRKSGLY